MLKVLFKKACALNILSIYLHHIKQTKKQTDIKIAVRLFAELLDRIYLERKSKTISSYIQIFTKKRKKK